MSFIQKSEPLFTCPLIKDGLFLSTVLGLINLCIQFTVVELVLLLPLLFRLRQPGADATKLGPTVEEENWSALNGVAFVSFREQVQNQQDKRRCVWKLRSCFDVR